MHGYISFRCPDPDLTADLHLRFVQDFSDNVLYYYVVFPMEPLNLLDKLGVLVVVPIGTHTRSCLQYQEFHVLMW